MFPSLVGFWLLLVGFLVNFVKHIGILPQRLSKKFIGDNLSIPISLKKIAISGYRFGLFQIIDYRVSTESLSCP